MLFSVLTSILAVAVISVFLYLKYKPTQDVQDSKEDSEEFSSKESEKLNIPSKKIKKQNDKKLKDGKEKFTHKWLLTTLKGHSGNISSLDFNTNGKFLASCADDRTIQLWGVKNLSQKEHKSVRVNVEYDCSTQVKWSPDTKAIVSNLVNENTLKVYRVGRKDDGFLGNIEPILTFPKAHEAEIINIDISCNGKFIMSCSTDTTVIIWDLKGEILSKINTLHLNNHYAIISPCGRFVATSGFSPEVKVWEVNFTKSGDFQDVTRAFELKGHNSGVYKFAFSNDSSRMASISKDKTWKLWDTNIEYKKQQDATLLHSGSLESPAECALALSPDGHTVAISTSSTLHIYSGVTGQEVALLENIFTVSISVIMFSPLSQFLLVAGGKHIHVFHNVQGYKNTLEDLEKKQKGATTASMKARLQSQVEEIKSTLKTLPQSC